MTSSEVAVETKQLPVESVVSSNVEIASTDAMPTIGSMLGLGNIAMATTSGAGATVASTVATSDATVTTTPSKCEPLLVSNECDRRHENNLEISDK